MCDHTLLYRTATIFSVPILKFITLKRNFFMNTLISETRAALPKDKIALARYENQSSGLYSVTALR